MLRDKGLVFSERTVNALTRATAHQLKAETVCRKEEANSGEPKSIESERPLPDNTSDVSLKADSEPEVWEVGGYQALAKENDHPGLEESEGLVLSPASSSFEALLGVERSHLVTEEQSDPSLKQLHDTGRESVSQKNISCHMRAGVLHRTYRSRRVRLLDQLVVPQKHRSDLLHLSHGSSWSDHLKVKETKDRLFQEFYWPGCFRDVENFVRSCDACQRLGKANEKRKAPLTLVPLIAESYRRLVIDIVGSLPVTKSRYKYVLTMICPATKFPKACLLKELSSATVVDAVLSVSARIGFPAEVQSDQGSVFMSSLTTTLPERCGIRISHSSVYHPQSNPVERWHSVLKRNQRALCFKQKKACLPATMFALRTMPHEATGFSPAELVSGRSLRFPLRMIRESWKCQGDDPTVVEYVLKLVECLQSKYPRDINGEHERGAGAKETSL